MGTGKNNPERVWRFGELCPDCGAPDTLFCALCAADLLTVGHGAVPVGPANKRQFVAVCHDCIDRLKAGQWPPFRFDTQAQIKDRRWRLPMPGSN